MRTSSCRLARAAPFNLPRRPPVGGFCGPQRDPPTIIPTERSAMRRPKPVSLRSVARSQGGFTLIELMIVVTIIGVLAMIAVPSYNTYIIRANRSAAKQFMLQVASRQEQYMLDARQYGTSVAQLSLTAPSEISNRYTFALAACANPCTTYAITATAIGSQTSDGNLTLDNLGTKLPADKWAK
jgi:type IV pilus assembly protein PilE